MKKLLCILALAGVALASPAIVQTQHAYVGNSVSVPSVGTGHLLVIAYSYNAAASATCSDSLGLTWTKQQEVENTASVTELQAWSARTTAGGNDTVTCTGETDNGITVMEVSGVSGVGASSQGSAIGSDASLGWPSVNTNSGDAVLALGATEHVSCQLVSATSPFSIVQNDTSHFDAQLSDLSAAGGSIMAAGTTEANCAQFWAEVSLDLTASGVTVTPPCTLSTLGAGICDSPIAATIGALSVTGDLSCASGKCSITANSGPLTAPAPAPQPVPTPVPVPPTTPTPTGPTLVPISFTVQAPISPTARSLQFFLVPINSLGCSDATPCGAAAPFGNMLYHEDFDASGNLTGVHIGLPVASCMNTLEGGAAVVQSPQFGAPLSLHRWDSVHPQ